MVIKKPLGRLAAHLPRLELPELGRTAEIPVYVIHNSPDPEDYFFLFNFEEFVERSKGGVFVRPKLKVWAGRSDFSRRVFARQVREVFAQEFDQMRAKLVQAQSRGKWGWMDFEIGGFGLTGLASSLVSNVVLLLAVSTGRALFGNISLPTWMRGKNAEIKLEDEIEDTKKRVEDALSRIDIALHRDLYNHAFARSAPGKLTGMDYDAWPLPAYVAEHLGDQKSGAWW